MISQQRQHDQHDQDGQHSDARERVLTVAERLFSERGYTSVTLRDIASALHLKHASLYHHVPDGKEALFVEVMERGLRRHQHGLEAAIQQAGPHIQAQLQAAARWLLAQPALDLGRMMQSDMPAISESHADRLSHIAFEALLVPISHIFREAAARGEIKHVDPTLLAGTILSFVESVHVQSIPLRIFPGPREALADTLIDVLLNGLRLSSPPASSPPSP